MTDNPERFRAVEPLVEINSIDVLAFRKEFPVHGIWIYGLGRTYTVAQARALRDWLTKALPESQEKVMPATKAQDHGITVNVGDDGAWVCFTTKSGKSFVFQPAQEWGNPNSLGHQAIREWCLEMQAKREATALPEEKS